jgi:hypothetical protein
VGMVKTDTGNGYWLVQVDGKSLPFGDAPSLPSNPILPVASGFVGMVVTPLFNI